MNPKKEFDLVIEAGSAEKNYWMDLWRYRELFYILSWRDVKVRYKQTVLGIAWSLLRPLLTMIILTLVFGKVAKLQSEDPEIPYAIVVFAGMLPWTFFANALSESSGSLIGNATLITKVYFPRLIVPASAVIVTLVDFFISFSILAGLMAWYGFVPSWHIIFLPLFILLAFMTAFGAGLLLTALNVKYRDFRYVIPFVVQFGLFVSPVGFSSGEIEEKWRLLYSLNPMVGVIDGFRWAIIGGKFTIYWEGFALSIGLCILITFIAVRYFRKMEKTFADVI